MSMTPEEIEKFRTDSQKYVNYDRVMLYDPVMQFKVFNLDE
jgi:hypothetical protein